MEQVFRYKSKYGVSYEQQGYIYFTSLCYHQLRAPQQEKIRGLCELAAGNNAPALLECVTTRQDMGSICKRHYIASRTTLYRALKRYYELFPQRL